MNGIEKKNEIISISIKPELLKEMNFITKEMGFSGRSETIRAGIRALKIENKERSKLKGIVNATLTVVHEHSNNISKISHNYQKIITSHLHNHIDNHKCLDIFILKGEASSVRNIVESFQRQRGIEQVKLTVC